MCACFSGLPSLLELSPANRFRQSNGKCWDLSTRGPNHAALLLGKSCNRRIGAQILIGDAYAPANQYSNLDHEKLYGPVDPTLPIAKTLSRRPFWKTRSFYSVISIIAALGVVFACTQQAAFAAAAATVNGAAAARPGILTSLQDSTAQTLRAMWSKFLLKWQLYCTIPVIAGLLNWATNKLAVKVSLAHMHSFYGKRSLISLHGLGSWVLC
jgi:hypothetical protein